MYNNKPVQEVNWDKYESYPPRIKEFMMNPRAFTRKRRENLCKDFILSEKFMRDYANYLDWGSISVYQTLSENFMKEYKHRLVWYYVTRNQKMSDEFIREMKDYITWSSFPYEKVKSIDFIREWKDYIDWNNFTIHFPIKNITREFVNEFHNELWWKYLKYRDYLFSVEIRERYKEEFNR